MIPLAMISNRIVWASCLVIMSIFGLILSFGYYPAYLLPSRQESVAHDEWSLISAQHIVATVSDGRLRGSKSVT